MECTVFEISRFPPSQPDRSFAGGTLCVEDCEKWQSPMDKLGGKDNLQAAGKKQLEEFRLRKQQKSATETNSVRLIERWMGKSRERGLKGMLLDGHRNTEGGECV